MHVVAKNYEQAHTHTWDKYSNDNNKDYLKLMIIRIIIYRLYLCNTAYNETYSFLHHVQMSNKQTKVGVVVE